MQAQHHGGAEQGNTWGAKSFFGPWPNFSPPSLRILSLFSLITLPLPRNAIIIA